MNMKYYHRNQKILILIAILVVLYNWFFYIQDSKLEKSGMLTVFKVIEQGCRSSKGSSSVHILYRGKVYYIRLANEECLEYPIGSKISLIYNDDFDYFYKPDGLKRNNYRLSFSIAFLFLSALPWNKFINRLDSK